MNTMSLSQMSWIKYIIRSYKMFCMVYPLDAWAQKACWLHRFNLAGSSRAADSPRRPTHRCCWMPKLCRGDLVHVFRHHKAKNRYIKKTTVFQNESGRRCVRCYWLDQEHWPKCREAHIGRSYDHSSMRNIPSSSMCAWTEFLRPSSRSSLNARTSEIGCVNAGGCMLSGLNTVGV